MSSRAQVLVAEDDSALRDVLALYLKQAGFSVVEASDGDAALAMLRDGNIDLALIDVMLPGIDGFEVVRRARALSSIPMLFVTARADEVSRVAGLELGADDYIVKPFFAHEVVARVRAHLRRASGFEEVPTTLRRGSLEIDVQQRRVTIGSDQVELTRREFDLLLVLLQHPGQAFGRSQLLERVWGSTFFTLKTVDVHISALRRKLGGALRITSLRGIGYRLEAQ
jgi:DNA-binding response OmpR family regulator